MHVIFCHATRLSAGNTQPAPSGEITQLAPRAGNTQRTQARETRRRHQARETRNRRKARETRSWHQARGTRNRRQAWENSCTTSHELIWLLCGQCWRYVTCLPIPANWLSISLPSPPQIDSRSLNDQHS